MSFAVFALGLAAVWFGSRAMRGSLNIGDSANGFLIVSVGVFLCLAAIIIAVISGVIS
ncbi:MAG: hypothetical protein H6881_08255 [Rhodobiaceae bacterium]|nr:hypothetical protein [Rhodobiaceae bacterium]MCC0051855.1 hypothetical protein [Rhodobiaceae bacterium]